LWIVANLGVIFAIEKEISQDPKLNGDESEGVFQEWAEVDRRKGIEVTHPQKGIQEKEIGFLEFANHQKCAMPRAGASSIAVYPWGHILLTSAATAPKVCLQ
jgi:hypothetical protein